MPSQNQFSKLTGAVLINNIRTFDLAARNAIVIGKVDPESEFMEIVSYPEDDEEEWGEEKV